MMIKYLLFLLAVLLLGSCTEKESSISEPEVYYPEYPPMGTQVILKSRHKYGDYEKATFSFEFATIDKTELTGNDWDILYGNGSGDQIQVNTVTDDESGIADLGLVNFDNITTIPLGVNYNDRATADSGHVYIVHTVDSETNIFSKFIITDMKSDDWIEFNWVRADYYPIFPSFDGK